jgi:deoxycytidine triphosphate deaminase
MWGMSDRYKSQDAFPEIQPALLNSADIYDYVAATGMIFPFEEDKLKPASYEVNLLGKCIYCDDEGKKKVEYIDQGKEFILKKNLLHL